MNLLRTVLAIAWLGLTVSACQSSDFKRTKMSTDSSTTAQAASQPSIQSVCLGRFVIDLPAGFTRTGDGAYKYEFVEIPKPTPITREDFHKNLDQFEAKLKATKHETDASLLLKVAQVNSDARILVFWEESFSGGLVNVEGRKWLDGFQFLLTVEASESKQDMGLAAMREPLTHIRPRAESDTPTEPGFCSNGGFIASDKWKVEEVIAGFDLAAHPDVHISINFYPLAKAAQDKPLLDRVDGGLMKMANLFSSVHTVRKGNRTVATYPGQEYLVAAPNESGQRAHMFTWETQGNGTRETPFITIEMTTGNKDDDGNTQRTKLSDEQALKIWDSIVSTFRLRPTSAPPVKVSEAPPPLTPLGELAATGRICPQTGWWQCTEEALPVKGGKKQFFRQGENMPRATLVGEPSMWQRVKGEAPEHRVATVWKLVEYEASERTPDAIAHAGDPKADQPTIAPTEPQIAAAEDAEPNDNGQAPPPKDA